MKYSNINPSNAFELLKKMSETEIVDYIAEKSTYFEMTIAEIFEKVGIQRGLDISPITIVLVSWANICLYDNSDKKAIKLLTKIGTVFYEKIKRNMRGKVNGRENEMPKFTTKDSKKIVSLLKTNLNEYSTLFRKFRQIEFEFVNDVVCISAAISVLRGYTKVVSIFSFLRMDIILGNWLRHNILHQNNTRPEILAVLAYCI